MSLVVVVFPRFTYCTRFREEHLVNFLLEGGVGIKDLEYYTR